MSATCTQHASFLEVIKNGAHHGQADDLAKISCVACSLWDHRNLLLHKSKNMSPIEAFERTLVVLHIHSLDTTNPDPVKWEASPINCLKLNVDGAMCSKLQMAEVGAIVQDLTGKVILAVSILEANMVNAKSIEVIAILGGL